MKSFNCTCCGECCSGNMTIRLNRHDIYKMANHLKLNHTKTLFNKGYLTLRTGENGIAFPTIKFKTTPYSFCPFLINDVDENMELKGYCSLHPYIKPLVCILAPISKEYDTEKGAAEYGFTRPTESCPGTLEGEDLPIERLIEPIKSEIEYEHRFYNRLDEILKTGKLEDAIELYYFDVEHYTPI